MPETFTYEDALGTEPTPQPDAPETFSFEEAIAPVAKADPLPGSYEWSQANPEKVKAAADYSEARDKRWRDANVGEKAMLTAGETFSGLGDMGKAFYAALLPERYGGTVKQIAAQNFTPTEPIPLDVEKERVASEARKVKKFSWEAAAVGAGEGLAETLPKLAPTVALGAIGGPLGLITESAAMGGIFGIDKEGNFHPKEAAIGALMPGVMRVAGSLTAKAVAGAIKAGVPLESKIAQNVIEAAGEQAALNAYMMGTSAPELIQQYKDDPLKFRESIGNIVGQNLAFGLFGVPKLAGLKPTHTEQLLAKNSDKYADAAFKVAAYRLVGRQGGKDIAAVAKSGGFSPRTETDRQVLNTTQDELDAATQRYNQNPTDENSAEVNRLSDRMFSIEIATGYEPTRKNSVQTPIPLVEEKPAGSVPGVSGGTSGEIQKPAAEVSQPKGEAVTETDEQRLARLRSESIANKEALFQERFVKKTVPMEQLQFGVQKVGDFGGVQVDEIAPDGVNTSTNPERLIQAGYKIPTSAELLKLPQGNYTYAQVMELLSKSKEAAAPETTQISPVAAVPTEPVISYDQDKSASALRKAGVVSELKESAQDGGDIIKVGGKPAGWMHVTDDGVLDAIDIKPEFQRKGIASKVIRDLAKLQGRNQLRVFLPTEQGRSLLESLGKLEVNDDGWGVLTLGETERPATDVTNKGAETLAKPANLPTPEERALAPRSEQINSAPTEHVKAFEELRNITIDFNNRKLSRAKRDALIPRASELRKQLGELGYTPDQIRDVEMGKRGVPMPDKLTIPKPAETPVSGGKAGGYELQQLGATSGEWQTKNKQTVETPEAKPSGAPIAETRTAAEVLNSSKLVKVKVPEGATRIQVTDTKGRKSLSTLDNVNKGDNVFRNTDVAKIEAGTIDRRGNFLPMKGEVAVKEVGLKNPHESPESKANDERAAKLKVEQKFVETEADALDAMNQKRSEDGKGPLKSIGGEGGVAAYYHDGVIYYVLDGIKSAEDFVRAQREEIAHHINSTPEARKVLQSLATANEFELERREIEAAYPKVAGETTDAYAERIANELLAKSRVQEAGLFQRIMDWVIEKLSNIKFVGDWIRDNPENRQAILRTVSRRLEADMLAFGKVDEPGVSLAMSEEPQDETRKFIYAKDTDVRAMRAYDDFIRNVVVEYTFTPDQKAEFLKTRRVEPLDQVAGESGAHIAGLEARAWRSIERAFALRIIFLDLGSNPAGIDGAVIKGVPDTIFLNARTKRALPSLIGHELLHNLRNENPDLYFELFKKLEPLVESGEFVNYSRAKKERMARRGTVMPDDKVGEELIAELVQDSFQDKAFWNKLAAKETTLFQKLATTVLDFLNSLTAKLREQGVYKYFTDVGKAHDAITETLAEFARDKGETDVPLAARVREESEKAPTQVQGVSHGIWREVEKIKDIQRDIRANIFDGTLPVTVENTAKAKELFGRMTGPDKAKAAGEIQTSTNAQMGPGLTLAEIYKYAVKMVKENGDDTFLRQIVPEYQNFALVGSGAGGTELGRGLRALQEGDHLLRQLYDIEKEKKKAIGEKMPVGPKLLDELIEVLKSVKPDAAAIETPAEAAITKKFPLPKSLRSLTESIQTSPYNLQSDPAWRRETAIQWFLFSKLSREQAEVAAAIYNDAFNKAFADAAEREALKVVGKSISPRVVEDFVRAIRAGALDPAKPWVDEMASKLGFTKPTPEQFKRLADLDEKLSKEMSLPERELLVEEMAGVFRQIKLPPNVVTRISANFVATLLTGLKTFTVNVFAPGAQLLSERVMLSATNPKDFMNHWKSLAGAWSNLLHEWKFTVTKDAFSFLNNDFQGATNVLKHMWEEGARDIHSKNPLIRAKGLYNLMRGAQQYSMRLLNAADQANMIAEREVKLTLYGSDILRRAGLGTKETSALVEAVGRLKYQMVQEGLAAGMSPDLARVRADSLLSDQLQRFVNNEFGELAGDEFWKATRAAELDAYNITGRLAHEEYSRDPMKETDEGGVASRILLHHLLEFSSKMRSKPGTAPAVAVAMLGFVNVPIRTARFYAWNSPYGLIRLGIHAFRKSQGWDNWWKQSLANEVQERHRLKMAIAATAVQAIFTGVGFALLGSSADDEEKKNGIYFTGDGPKNKNLKDAWTRRGFQAQSVVMFVNGKPARVPMTRVGEPLSHLFWLLSARDDWAWRKKEAEAGGRPFNEPPSETIMRGIGTYAGLLGQRGPFQTMTQLSKASAGEGGATKILATQGSRLASAAFTPFLALQSSFDGMIHGPIDQSSLDSAIMASFPVLGVFGDKYRKQQVNRFGDPLYDRSWFARLSQTGIPIAFRVSQSPENEKMYPVLVDKGAAPPVLRRYILEEKFGPLTDDQYADYAKRSGAALKADAIQNISNLRQMKPEDAKKWLSQAATRADRQTELDMNLQRTKPLRASSSGSGASYLNSGGSSQRQSGPSYLRGSSGGSSRTKLRGYPSRGSTRLRRSRLGFGSRMKRSQFGRRMRTPRLSLRA